MMSVGIAMMSVSITMMSVGIAMMQLMQLPLCSEHILLVFFQAATKFRLRRARKDLHTLNKGVLHAK